MYKHVVLAFFAIVFVQNNIHAQHRGFNADSRDYELMMDQLEIEERFNQNCVSFERRSYINDHGEKVDLSLNCEKKQLEVHVDNQSISLDKQCQDHRFENRISYMPFHEKSHAGISLMSYTLNLSFEVNTENKLSSDYKSRGLLDFEYDLLDKTFTLRDRQEKSFDMDGHDISCCSCLFEDELANDPTCGGAFYMPRCCHSQGEYKSKVRCPYKTVFTEQ